jgi:hypothetical protein
MVEGLLVVIAILLVFILAGIKEILRYQKILHSHSFDTHKVIVFGRNPKEFGGDGPYEDKRPSWISSRQV